MSTNQPTTFEERFKAFIPEEMRVLSKGNEIDIVHQHDDAGILVKSIAYFIDLGVSVLILPIIYNVYHYLRRGQTLGQQIMGIRIYRFRHVGKPTIASISQLLIRFLIKLFFLATWTIIGMNLTGVLFRGYLSGESTFVGISILYKLLMIIWIHGYIYTMYINEHRRGIQDLWAGTVVAYDRGYRVKRIILGTVLCAILYYIILIAGPHILDFVMNKFDGPWIETYWSIWNWIDYWVLRGINTVSLAK